MDEQSCLLLSKNRDLEVLNMSMCYGIGAAEIRWIVEGCKKLDSWNLAWTDLPTDALELICSSSPRSLKRINISGCREKLLDERMHLVLLLLFFLFSKTRNYLFRCTVSVPKMSQSGRA